MYSDDFFQSPVGRIASFADAQLHLYRRDVALQDYFSALQLDTPTGPRIGSGQRSSADRLFNWATQSVQMVGQLRARRKIKTDVLFCPTPYFDREAENQFRVRALLGLAQTDAKILCLLPHDARCRSELDDRLAAAGRTGQVTFLDPTASSGPMDKRLRSMRARVRARLALEQTVQILEPHGLGPGEDVRAPFEHAAYFVEAWESLAPSVEFDAVVARCHWNTFCGPVCRTARGRGKPVVTFQQGVIGHTLDVPVTASKYVAFGRPSASFLSRMNHRFFEAAGMPEPSVEYVNGGCLYDKVIALPDQFENQTLLMVDIPPAPGDFYGIGSQGEAMLDLAEKLLSPGVPLCRLVIRPHPYWSTLNLEACQNLVRKHPTRCELSHPVWPLEDDLRRSSVVVGILSGVLTVASACGLPTVFLETERGYTTGDLACFSPGQTLLPDAAFCEIRKLLTDRNAYAVARAEALRNAREYYTNGGNLELDGAFFERLLRTQSAANRPPVDMQ